MKVINARVILCKSVAANLISGFKSMWADILFSGC